MARLVFHNIEDFYNDDPKRRYSCEADFGVHWRNGRRTDSNLTPRYRLSYVEETGELYADEVNSGTVFLVGVIPQEDIRPTGGERYWVKLDREILQGWSTQCVKNDYGIQWVKERLGEYAVWPGQTEAV